MIYLPFFLCGPTYPTYSTLMAPGALFPPHQQVPIVIPQLRAVGVRTLRAALDTDVFMGVTEKQEVIVWGNGRGVPFFGLKPQEMVDLELYVESPSMEKLYE